MENSDEIEKLNSEFKLKEKRLELEYELEKKRFYLKEEMREKRSRKEMELKIIKEEELKHLNDDNLIEILEFKNKKLENNLSILEKQEQKQEKLLKQSKLFIVIAIFIGLISLSILVISFFLAHRSEPPYGLISLSIICAFLSGLWFYTNWKNFNSAKVSSNNINCMIKKHGFVFKEIEQLIKRKESFNE
jgi:hypothetical protein